MLAAHALPPKLLLQMSYIPEPHQPPQWSRSEQLTLLTNILKDLDSDLTNTLMQLIQQRGGQPRWNEISLPEGRSLNSCVAAYDDMRRRSSSGSVGHQSYAMPPGMYPAPSQLGTLIQRKRSYNEQDPQLQAQRVLQPKPPRSIDSPLPSATPVTNGETLTFMARSSPIDPAGTKPQAKKRGRPNKDELDRRRAEAEARGEVYPDPKRKRPRHSEAPKREATPAAPTLPRDSLRSISDQTPRRPSPEPAEQSSSGKRRRQKQREKGDDAMVPEEDDSNLIDMPKEAQSPSERLLMKGTSSSRSPAMQRDTQSTDAPGSDGRPDQPTDSAGSSKP